MRQNLFTSAFSTPGNAFFFCMFSFSSEFGRKFITFFTHLKTRRAHSMGWIGAFKNVCIICIAIVSYPDYLIKKRHGRSVDLRIMHTHRERERKNRKKYNSILSKLFNFAASASLFHSHQPLCIALHRCSMLHSITENKIYAFALWRWNCRLGLSSRHMLDAPMKMVTWNRRVPQFFFVVHQLYCNYVAYAFTWFQFLCWLCSTHGRRHGTTRHSTAHRCRVWVSWWCRVFQAFCANE